MVNSLLFLLFTNIVILYSCLTKGIDSNVESNLEANKIPDSGNRFIPLNGLWNLENKNGSIRVTARVPGCVHSALERSGLIGDPYFRFNDVNYRWIVYDDWTYYRSFTVPDLVDRPSIWLKMSGLDTVARVILNGVEAGRSNNQFIVHHFNVTHLIKAGENEIRVEFTSAVKYAANRSSAYAYDVPPDCPPPQYHPECHANFIRKSQCSFSWDWGPAFPTQAIWKDVSLIISNYDVSFKEILIQPILVNDSWFVNMTVSFLIDDQQVSNGILYVYINGFNSQNNISVSRNKSMISVYFPVQNIEPWFPRGFSHLGGQRLYEADIRYWALGNAERVIRARKMVGFRKVEIIQEAITNGLTFYFKINGYDIFLKGSNWIPMDSFVDRITEDKLKNLLLAATGANMNVLRVWGGGVYESDRFYELCDQLGIMVWQDFMFACAMYPVDQPFLESVSREISDQVMRTGSHPSIIAWSGNNENEAAIVGDWYGTAGPMYDTYKKEKSTDCDSG